jgi:hypothetical protein
MIMLTTALSYFPSSLLPSPCLFQACGPKIGAHNKYWTWLSYVIDSSLYPRFAAAYMAKALGQGYFVQSMIAVGIVLGVTIVSGLLLLHSSEIWQEKKN